MGKILAIVGLIVFVWLAIPRAANGQWIAPTALQPGVWISSMPDMGADNRQYIAASSTPSQGYGWFHFDFWNNRSLEGEVVTKRDTRIFR